ncbi:MAG: hypothetical protein ACYCSG_03755 [Thermoplasmataceae archaeon]
MEANSRNDIVCENCGATLQHQSTQNIDLNSQNFTGDISNTITGFLLLGIGTAMMWIPIVGDIGILIDFIGVILIFVNRKNFESAHGTYVILSILIYAISFILIIYVSTFTFIQINSSSIKNSIDGSLQALVLASIIGSAIGAISFFLISFGLQDRTGKFILTIGLIALVITDIIIGTFLYSALPAAVSNSISSGSYNPAPINAFRAKVSSYTLYTALSYIIFAVAYLRLYSSLKDNTYA